MVMCNVYSVAKICFFDITKKIEFLVSQATLKYVATQTSLRTAAAVDLKD